VGGVMKSLGSTVTLDPAAYESGINTEQLDNFQKTLDQNMNAHYVDRNYGAPLSETMCNMPHKFCQYVDFEIEGFACKDCPWWS
jgi:hypothetical protein